MNTTAITLTDKELEDLSTITLHFDVRDEDGNDKHSIPRSQFVDTANAVQMIIDDFNRAWFDGKLPIELYMPSLEEGGLMMFIEAHPIIGAGIVTSGVGITGYCAYNFAKGAELDKAIQNLGKKAKYKVANLSTKIKLLYNKEHSNIETDVTLALSKISLIVIMFLALPNQDLIEAGITPENTREAYIGKNNLIEAAQSNPETKGLGFDKYDNFPILRKDFKDYISDIPPVQTNDNQPTEEIIPQIEIVDIQVEGTHYEDRKANWNTTNKKQFVMEDENFWAIWTSQPKPDKSFPMKVQWIFHGSSKKPTNIIVIRVIEYNGEKIANPLNNQEREQYKQKNIKVKPTLEPMPLFDDITPKGDNLI